MDDEYIDVDEYIGALRKALAKAIAEADGWYDDLRGDGLAPNLDEERKLLGDDDG